MKRDELFTYALKAYKTKPEYLWERWPNFAILRHSENNKWYAAIMNVPAEKFGIDKKDEIDILNIKCDPEDALMLRLADDIYPAWHMNKKHWISVAIDGNVPDELVLELLDASYQLTL